MTLKSQKKVFPSGTTLDVAMQELEGCIFVWGHPHYTMHKRTLSREILILFISRLCTNDAQRCTSIHTVIGIKNGSFPI